MLFKYLIIFKFIVTMNEKIRKKKEKNVISFLVFELKEVSAECLK